MKIHGKLWDNETRCEHYHSQKDIIAIRFKCCNEYYCCYHCHKEEAGHLASVWTKNEFKTDAIFCGNCKNEMSIAAYLNCTYKCPFCQAAFNPGCANHNHFYFEE